MSANIENLLLQAQELEATNDYKKLTEVYRSIATCYHRIKDKQKEVEYLKKSKDAATQLDSGGVREQAQIKFASIMDLPDGHEKEDLLLKFHKDNPLVLSAAFELGNFYERQANYPSAILYYESVLFLVENQTPPLTKDQEENKAQLYLGLIGCYKKGGIQNNRKLKAYFEGYLRIHPEKGEITLGLVALLSSEELGEYQQACTYFEKSFQYLHDVKTLAYSYIVYANIKLNYLDEPKVALEYAEKAYSIYPNDQQIIVVYAMILAKLKDFKKAISIIEPFFKEIPHDAALGILIGQLYSSDGDLAKAKQYFLKAILLNREDVSSRIYLYEILKTVPYITSLEVKKLRHIEHLNIAINPSKHKHLVLTGRNGSGKSSILKSCRDFLSKITESPIDELFTEKFRADINSADSITLLQFKESHLADSQIESTPNIVPLELESKDQYLQLRYAYESGVFVIKYLGADTGEGGDRSLNPQGVSQIEKVQIPWVNEISGNLANKVVAYLVDLDYTRLRAYRNKEEAIYTEIDRWFDNFKTILQKIDKHILDIVYTDAGNLHNFILKVESPENSAETIDVKFDELPDGFKATFKIVFEILMQMQSKVTTSYKLPGIVMIDEPELFLHIELQGQIMPFLTELFPNIQFIVATHSPYVLNSMTNAVIFDLTTHQRLSDASEIPPQDLADNYLRFTKEYVESTIKKLNEFVGLVELYKDKKLNPQQSNRLAELDIELENVTPYISNEYYETFRENQKFLYE